MTSFVFKIMVFDKSAKEGYHGGLMSEQWAIDPLVFARKGSELCGEIPLSHMARLCTALASDIGTVQVYVRGRRDGAGRSTLDCEIACRLSLECQRCLEPFEFDLQREAHFVLVESDDALPELDEEEPDVETIVGRGRLDLTALVEDEILLSLPIAPRHPTEECTAGPVAAAADPGV